MAATNGGRLFLNFCTAYVESIKCTPGTGILSQVRGYAARRGTRERARKSKVKVEVKKVGFIPHNQRHSHKTAKTSSKRLDDSWKSVSPDDVWVAKYYRWKVYSFADAVECHREMHHPTILNAPDIPLVAFIELNMQGVKKNKFVDKFTRTIGLPHPWDQNQNNNVVALCKGEDYQKLAWNAGAALVGGSEVIKDIMSGKVSLSNYTAVVAHPNILPELAALKGLLKKSFPNFKDGTLNHDIVAVVKTFTQGIKYQATRDEIELDYGLIQTPFGKLNMDVKQLEENFSALLKDVNSRKPKREGSFITKTLLTTPISPEKFKVDFSQYIDAPEVVDKEDDDDDEDDEPVATASSSQ